MEEKLYAVIDGTCEEGLQTLLDDYDPPASCLYGEPIQPEMLELAPYLVEVTEPVQAWLAKRKTDWGIYLTSKATLRDLRHHLRKYLQVQVPTQTKPVYFRFYDPRNIWLVCETLSDWDLHRFLGPIIAIKTTTEDNEKSDTFQQRRAQFPDNITQHRKMLSISEAQLIAINQAFKARYIQRLAKSMQRWTGYHLWDYTSFAHALFDYFTHHKITDDRTIQALTYYLVKQGYGELDDIPEFFFSALHHPNRLERVNAELFLIEKLGKMPSLFELQQEG